MDQVPPVTSARVTDPSAAPVPPGADGETVARQVFADGVAHLQGGRLRDAEAAFRRVASLVPAHATSWLNVGLLRHHGGDAVGAIAPLTRALTLDPGIAAKPDLPLRRLFRDAHAMAQRQGHPTAHNSAIARLWLRWLPDDLGALGAATMAALADGDYAQAEDVLSRAPERPADSTLRHAQALLDLHRGRPSRAARAVRDALILAPRYAEAWFTQGTIAQRRSAPDEADTALRRALHLSPGHPGTLLALAGVRVAEGRADDGAALALQIPAPIRRAAPHIGTLLTILHHAPSVAPEVIRAERQALRPSTGPAASVPRPEATPPPPPLRVVYLGDCSRPQVAALALPAIRAHARADAAGRIVCHIFHAGPPDRPAPPPPEGADVPVLDLGVTTPQAIGDSVRRLAPHVLVLLTPTTLPQALEAVAHRLAPLQVIWGDVFGSVGWPGLDALLTDAHHVTDPALLSERPVLLPHGAYFFAPPVDAPDPGPLPCRSHGHVTFGSFNRLDKINDPLLARWGRILAAVPDSRLLIQARALDTPTTRDTLLDRLARHGVPTNRVRLEGGRDRAGMTDLYRQADLALDADPWSGGLTVLELLWMGVPVVTLAGRHPCGRHAVSHLRRVGLDDWVAETPEAYVARAAAGARDTERLTVLRADLRRRLAALPLCDATVYARQLEDAYETLWADLTAVSEPTASGTPPASRRP